MDLTPEQQKELAEFPPILRSLIETELAAGNVITEIGHSFPAPPAGAYLKLARKVSTRPRTSGDSLVFHERNSSLYSGEFTDAKRFHFVLEPPNPQPLPPDMDVIRETNQSKARHSEPVVSPQPTPAQPSPCDPTRPKETNHPPRRRVKSANRFVKRPEEALSAEQHLDSIPRIQIAILDSMKQGASFCVCHKEGGTNIYWRNGGFVRSDYGEEPAQQTFANEQEFLDFLRRFYDWETSKHVYPNKVPEIEAWKLIYRLLRPA